MFAPAEGLLTTRPYFGIWAIGPVNAGSVRRVMRRRLTSTSGVRSAANRFRSDSLDASDRVCVPDDASEPSDDEPVDGDQDDDAGDDDGGL